MIVEIIFGLLYALWYLIFKKFYFQHFVVIWNEINILEIHFGICVRYFHYMILFTMYVANKHITSEMTNTLKFVKRITTFLFWVLSSMLGFFSSHDKITSRISTFGYCNNFGDDT